MNSVTTIGIVIALVIGSISLPEATRAAAPANDDISGAGLIDVAETVSFGAHETFIDATTAAALGSGLCKLNAQESAEWDSTADLATVGCTEQPGYGYDIWYTVNVEPNQKYEAKLEYSECISSRDAEEALFVVAAYAVGTNPTPVNLRVGWSDYRNSFYESNVQSVAIVSPTEQMLIMVSFIDPDDAPEPSGSVWDRLQNCATLNDDTVTLSITDITTLTPANDDFDNAVNFKLGGKEVANNTYATSAWNDQAGQGDLIHWARNDGYWTRNVWYAYSAESSETVVASNYYSDCLTESRARWTYSGPYCGDTFIQVLKTSDEDALEEVVFNDDCGRFENDPWTRNVESLMSCVAWDAVAGTTYYIAIGNYSESSGHFRLEIRLEADAEVRNLRAPRLNTGAPRIGRAITVGSGQWAGAALGYNYDWYACRRSIQARPSEALVERSCAEIELHAEGSKFVPEVEHRMVLRGRYILLKVRATDRDGNSVVTYTASTREPFR